jgi:hypothetical protein
MSSQVSIGTERKGDVIPVLKCTLMRTVHIQEALGSVVRSMVNAQHVCALPEEMTDVTLAHRQLIQQYVNITHTFYSHRFAIRR